MSKLRYPCLIIKNKLIMDFGTIYVHIDISFGYHIEKNKRSKIHNRRPIPTQMSKTTSALVDHYRSPVSAGMNVDPVETPIQEFCKNLESWIVLPCFLHAWLATWQ